MDRCNDNVLCIMRGGECVDGFRFSQLKIASFRLTMDALGLGRWFSARWDFLFSVLKTSRHKPITHPAHRKKMPGTGPVLLKVFSEGQYIVVYGAGGREYIVAPYGFEDRFA